MLSTSETIAKQGGPIQNFIRKIGLFTKIHNIYMIIYRIIYKFKKNSSELGANTKFYKKNKAIYYI